VDEKGSGNAEAVFRESYAMRKGIGILIFLALVIVAMILVSLY
jgi:hypothetical protein